MPLGPTVEQSVREAFLRIWALYQEGPEALDELFGWFAPEVTFWGTGAGERADGLEAFARLTTNEVAQSEEQGVAFEFAWVKVGGGDRFAWVEAEGQTSATDVEGAMPPMRVTFVFERRELGWKVVHLHASWPWEVVTGDDVWGVAFLKARNEELEAAVARRVEELEATQDRLVYQEKMASLGRLTAGVAHEIKNPLNFVNNFAGLSRELIAELRTALGTQLDGDVGELLGELEANAAKIEEHGKRADAIVRSMLNHARTSSGIPQPVEVNELVREYANLAYHGMRAKHPGSSVVLELNLGPGIAKAEWAPQEVGRVVLNLVENAFDAVQQRALQEGAGYVPTAIIATDRVPEGIEIRVTDNGTGIPAEIRDRVFEPFFTTKAARQGTGLGLSLVYDLVTTGHGGSIEVESEEGIGTTFVVTIPLKAPTPLGRER